MTAHRLWLRVGRRQLEQLGTGDFLWRPRGGGDSSFETSISPRLEELGDVPPLHVDLVRLAVLVFCADRSTLRDQGFGVRWDRDLELIVPVSAPDDWSAAADKLAGLLHVLSGDRWQLAFERARAARRGRVAEAEPAEIVCLFSGGADSLAGALAAQAQTGPPPVLVSHWDNMATSATQSRLVARLEQLWSAEPIHHRLQVQRRRHQVRSGVAFRDEKSRRTRSFLFVALGLAVAAARGAELWISENGFTSLNPPLCQSRGRALSGMRATDSRTRASWMWWCAMRAGVAGPLGRRLADAALRGGEL